MIRINLAPVEELESPYWWLPDATILVLVVIVGFFGVQTYLGSIQKQVEALAAERDSLRQSSAQLAPELDRFKNLDANIKVLRTKVDALKAIIGSPIARYKPIIVMEHLQNLKPEGVWLNTVKIPSDSSTVSLSAQAFDNILVAEFLSSMLATQNQEVDPSDLRTQIYFTNGDLDWTRITGGNKPNFEELRGSPEFNVKFDFKERTAPKAGTMSISLGEPVMSREQKGVLR